MISLRTRLWGPPCKSQEQLMCRHCQCPDPLIHSKLACFPAASACISLPEYLSGLWNLFCSPLQKARNARELTFSGERLQTTTSGDVRTNTPGQRTNIPLPLSGVDTWGTCSSTGSQISPVRPSPSQPQGLLAWKWNLHWIISSLPYQCFQNCLPSKLTALKSLWPTLCPTVKCRNQNWPQVIKHYIFRAQIVLMLEDNTQ